MNEARKNGSGGNTGGDASTAAASSPAPGGAAAPGAAARLELVQGLGGWAAASIVVGTMIGTGIFLVPSSMATDSRSIGLVFLAWILGGLLSLAGALSYAELGAAIPEAGGDYAYLNRGFGPRWGYLFGWMHSVVGRPCSVATIAAGLMRFCGFLRPTIGQTVVTYPIWMPFAHAPYNFKLSPAQPLAVGAIALVTFINYLGVRLGGRVQVVLTAIKILAVCAVIVLALAMGQGGISNFQPFLPDAWGAGAWSGLLAAMVAAAWAYDGWSNVNLVGSEVINPQRNIPLALVAGVSGVMLLYLLANAAYFWALPFAAVAHSQHVASDVIASFAGSRAARWLTVAMVISALGTLNSSILSGARVPYAMGRDGLFFGFTGKVDTKFRTPAGALLFQAYLASVLALTGTFEDLFSLFIFAQWIFYALVVASVYGLRRREPDLPRAYRTWGYPWVPGVFIAGAFALTVSLWAAHPVRSTIGLALILLGLVFYPRWQRGAAAARNAG
ncbi:MAG TPA: amino acid permease [Candidatus Acidoferrales bacterium]|nr:amino acid permease [Candidatus Acidoferrales bacterium]